jgi:outer membrane protein insertion porin family
LVFSVKWNVKRRQTISLAVAGALWFICGAYFHRQTACAQSAASPTNRQYFVLRGGDPDLLRAASVPDAGNSVAAKSDASVSDPQSGQSASSGASLKGWQGQPVKAIEFRGVESAALDPLPTQLAQRVGSPLDPELVRQSLRRLFSTGLYQGIEVRGIRTADGIVLIFDGKPQYFIGLVQVNGVKSDRLTSQLVNATKLSPGAPLREEGLVNADKLLQQTLADSGYYEAKITRTEITDAPNLQVNVNYTVTAGKKARVGDVRVTGDSGMPVETFRKKAKLKSGSKVERSTVSRALSSLRKNYQKKDRLEADVTLESKEYQPPKTTVDYGFNANQGPVVKVEVTGVKLSAGKIKKLVPVYEEGAVDEDLLNEGARNLRDYYQREGFFDVKVTHSMSKVDAQNAKVVFNVDRGPIHHVDSVTVSGNKYFDSDTLRERLSVRKADVFSRHGLYSQSLVNADVGSLTAIYQMNGFSHVKVTPEVDDTDTHDASTKVVAQLRLKYEIDEGPQQKIGQLNIEGTSRVSADELRPQLSTQPGQPYSPQNVAGDRDLIRAYYLSHGFENMQLQVSQLDDPKNDSLVDVTMKITEGEQFFVNKVLISGLHYTRPEVVDRQVKIHADDALDQSALLETQRSLYDLALFNEVNTAIQNPAGDELRKNVLLQLTEARRWDINYGFGFEAQTGTPNCGNVACPPNGQAGVSPKVIFELSRINLKGRDQSISLRTAYGSLEKRATFVYNVPHLLNNPNFNMSFSGGYTNSQDITTYSAAWLEGAFRVTERFLTPNRFFSRANTFIYSMTYRRVQLNSVNVSPETIPLASQPVRVGGPGLTYIRDTRDEPLDAHRGTYNSLQEFLASSYFGSQADFNRIDYTNSSYYTFGKRRWVLARSTRFGFENPFGGPVLYQIPLPERLYAGGASSHRGFTINAAGPRDPQTGYPIGGEGAFINSTELRMPNPTLPWVGTSLGFVLFLDMGNVFSTPSQIWPSFLRVSQPNQAACKVLNSSQPTGTIITPPTGGELCRFDYFSYAPGLGLRYSTPIGPIRVDFSYNLNPPIYPVTCCSTNTAIPFPSYVGQAPHFNFFFSVGQSF